MKSRILKAVTIVLFSLLLCYFLFWCGSLAKNHILTAIHKDEIVNLQFDEPLPEFDWYRILSYSNENIEIYYVNTLGKNTDNEYKIGGRITCTKMTAGWHHTSIEESVLWSGAGSADNYIWPYWYHIFLR